MKETWVCMGKRVFFQAKMLRRLRLQLTEKQWLKSKIPWEGSWRCCLCVFKDVGFMMVVSIGCFVVKFRFFVTKVPGTVFLGDMREVGV